MTKEILLTQEKVALVDDEDYEYLNQWKWCAFKSEKDNTYYAVRGSGGRKNHKTIWMHRFIIQTPDGMDTDHINRDGLDNRRCNLRAVTKSQNQRNKNLSKNNTSGYMGVSWDKSRERWAVQSEINGKSKHLGRYKRLQDAINARMEFEKSLPKP